ncbi:MAG: hypothetical protein RIS97_1194 [Pseudomonadota bacterium]|jgi:hypothetical protein
MIEAIKTFFRRKQTIVKYGLVWRCTKCHLIFITKAAGEKHPCQDQNVN